MVALEWGLDCPSDFWAHSKEDQYLMAATIEAKGLMAAWDQQVAEGKTSQQRLLDDDDEEV